MHVLHEYQRYSGLFQCTIKPVTLTNCANKSEFAITKVQLVNLPECQEISMKMSSDSPKFILKMLFLVRIRQSFCIYGNIYVIKFLMIKLLKNYA